MTSFEVVRRPFSRESIALLAEEGRRDHRLSNWPVVYTLNGATSVYVGETLSASSRMHQHAANPARDSLEEMRILIDPTFNKSVCLDLEAFLIGLFSGEGRFAVENLNAGITNADYYDRDAYRERFREIFESLRADGLFEKSIPAIENSALFKYSPFKSLSPEQAAAVEDILEGLLDDLRVGSAATSVIQGGPGTGKTIVAVYLVKLLRDIARSDPSHHEVPDGPFGDYFIEGNRELLQSLSVGLVVPQQSLRETISRVFKKTPGLRGVRVMTPFDVGKSLEPFDVLIVDEAHRLSQRANMPSAAQNASFREINERLFGEDLRDITQLDWIVRQSRHRILMLDAEQTVRPADLPRQVVNRVIAEALQEERSYRLATQMRVRAGSGYIGYIRGILGRSGPTPTPRPEDFGEYRLEFFEDLGEMHDEIRRLDAEHGLCRLVAGYGWQWRSRKEPQAADIVLDGRALQWNRTAKDWISSPTSLEEVGSIHTVQGYDLNFAGVIIGPEVGFDEQTRQITFRRASYFDTKGKENNPALGITYSDDDLLAFVANIYGVLLTRGILGTFVYVVDPTLREHLRPFFSART